MQFEVPSPRPQVRQSMLRRFPWYDGRHAMCKRTHAWFLYMLFFGFEKADDADEGSEANFCCGKILDEMRR